MQQYVHVCVVCEICMVNLYMFSQFCTETRVQYLGEWVYTASIVTSNYNKYFTYHCSFIIYLQGHLVELA